MHPKTRLVGSKRLSPSEEFIELAQFAKASEQNSLDFYGVGEQLTSFEIQVAEDLDFEAAVFMPSGTMAQQIALKIHSQNSSSAVAFHPLSHLEVYEEHGYRELHHMKSLLLGEKNRCLKLSDIEGKEISTLLYELPQRDLGGEAPAFEELEKISEYCRENKIPLHLDGARVWECAPYYKKSVKEICALFDSVYISFYKGLNAIAGAMLLGEDKFIAQSKVWQRRHGGNLIHLYPYALSAQMSYQQNLSKMPLYFKKACEIAAIFNTSKLLKTHPQVPHSNMFHLFFKEDVKTVESKLISLGHKYNTVLFANPREITLSKGEFECFTEVSIGDHSIVYDIKQLKDIVAQFF